MCCPGMTLPTRQDLAENLLEESYNEVKAGVLTALKKEMYLSVVTDGWSDPNSESVVNFMVTSPFIRPPLLVFNSHS